MDNNIDKKNTMKSSELAEILRQSRITDIHIDKKLKNKINKLLSEKV